MPIHYELTIDNLTIGPERRGRSLDELVTAFETTTARLREALDAGLELDHPAGPTPSTFRFITTDPELAVRFGMSECNDVSWVFGLEEGSVF
jgi:hypothetical protein